MCRVPIFAGVILILLGPGILHPSGGRAGDRENPSRKYALLVGCTEYPNHPMVPELYGPGNDVQLFARLLMDRFNFPEKNILRLAGWPREDSKRPTARNIAAAFEELIKKAGPGDQVVILLSGHGTQIPIPEDQNPLDPKNFEPDGLDEVFLPADAKPGGPRGLENIIVDDQIGAWLDRFRVKKVRVWIIFDCCHSGDMIRGPEEGVRWRAVRPEILGIPKADIDRAQKRARAAVKLAKEQGTFPESPPSDYLPREKGSLVASYAAQSFEKAPEFPLPRGSPQEKEYYHGMLTYHLARILSDNKGQLSYRELTRTLVGQYRGDWGFGPTPYAEGDLDGEVLGLEGWPKHAGILLEKVNGKLRINAGELRGLNPGSILAVLSPEPAGEKKENKILGYVVVDRAVALSAAVKPMAFRGLPALATEKFPGSARCDLVARDVGEMRLKLTLLAQDDSAQKKLADILDNLFPKTREMLLITKEVKSADWILAFTTPDEAKTRWGIDLPKPGILFLQKDFPIPTGEPGSGKGRILAQFTEDSGQTARRLDGILQRVYTWQNLWRIAGNLGLEKNEAAPVSLTLEVRKLKDKDQPAGPLPPGSAVVPGQRIEIVVRNEGFYPAWVTLLFMDGNFGIDVKTLALAGKKSTRPLRGTIVGDSWGTEGIIVLAVAQKEEKDRPDLGFLEQAPLKNPFTGRGKTRGAEETALGRLLSAAAFGKTRSADNHPLTNPAVVSWSWVTRPGKK